MKYPLFKPFISTEECLQNLRSVFESGYFSEGEWVTSFREQLVSFIGNDKLVLTNSCTSALTLALRIANVNPGDTVLSTPMTCVATNTPILASGARVRWVDIDPDSGCVSVESVKRAFYDSLLPFKALVCVDWAGNPCELEELQKMCHDNNVVLIQDAAHAFGAKYKGVDISEFAYMTCLSFQAIKHLTTGDGGAVVSGEVGASARDDDLVGGTNSDID